MKNNFLCLIALGFLFTGCAYQQQSTNMTTIKGEEWLSVECFQTLGNVSNFSHCLAKDSNWDVYYIINITCPTSSKNEIYYDGKSLSGRYVFVGTYTYESKNGSKTVRAYMPKGNYLEWCNYNKERLINSLNLFLSYNSITL